MVTRMVARRQRHNIIIIFNCDPHAASNLLVFERTRRRSRPGTSGVFHSTARVPSPPNFVPPPWKSARRRSVTTVAYTRRTGNVPRDPPPNTDYITIITIYRRRHNNENFIIIIVLYYAALGRYIWSLL